MPNGNNDPSFTHVVTLRDIYEQGQRTHESVIRLEGKVQNVNTAQKDTERKVGILKDDTNRRLGSLELDRAKVLGMAAGVAILSSGGTAGFIQFINNK